VRFLADENIHADIVAWLRSLGQDVLYAAESLAGRADDDLLDLARRERRIIVTDDKDFGELVFHRRLAAYGVMLIRLSTPALEARLRRLREIWPAIESQAEGRFVVLGDRKVRIRPMTTMP
jgi:predicted nuclease of predicted toxin-antitoxin system